MDIKVSGHDYLYDITSMSLLFFPGRKVNYVSRSNDPTHIISRLTVKQNKLLSITKIKYNGKWYTAQKTAETSCDRKNLVKQTFYKACSKATGITSEWGILTGIRPLSVYERHLKTDCDLFSVMKKEYFLSDEKIRLLSDISSKQKSIAVSSDTDVSVYISIPFCPGKCSYCSFISVSAVNANNLLDKYLECLYKEIHDRSELIRKYGMKVRSLYVGGGTPGILDEKQMLRLLSVLDNCFVLSNVEEVCFELGRPETVTDGKLNILKSFNVKRICINVQTTNDDILINVNRKHTSADYFNAVKAADKFNFESINTDIIAGLPGESVDSFCRSVDDVINTGVNNITVHTLAIKRASALRDCVENYDPKNFSVIRMLDYAYNKIRANGYLPYYIYRQKNCVSNGENTGFCKPQSICKYNVYMMEDIHSIIACGSGASSKIIKNGRVSRVINVKYPTEYVNEYFRVVKNTETINTMLRADFCNE